MYRNMLKTKLHQVVVTDTNLNYMGSITIDRDIIEKGDILSNERVQVVNINTGARFETYVIPGERGSGDICLNGAAARMVQPGDRVIIMSYVQVTEEEAQNWQARVFLFNENNKIIKEADE